MLTRLRRDERGFVMVTVLLVTFVLLMATVVVLNRAVGSQNISRHDQDWNAALAAAEAGIDDYLYRTNNSSVIPPSPTGNTAIAPSWKSVPGPASGGQFSYAVDSSTLAVDGTIRLMVSGRVNGVVRTVEATLRRKTFLDYMYFTNYETVDPALYGSSPYTQYTQAQALANCARYYYGSPARNSNCTDIQFITGDVINGPLHSNDAILINGSPVFNGATTTSWNTSAPRYRCSGSCSPTFALSGDPKYVQPLTMPPSNTGLKAVATAAGGCLFTGPTSITLNSGGTMTVNSPFTKSSNCAKTGTYAIPSNGIIYVQTVPASSSDPNYTAGCPYNVGGKLHPLGYPLAAGDVTTYNCRDGDVFLKGTLGGQLTIAAENDIDVIGNVTYAGGLTGSDLLGLIPNEYVWVYHPVDTNGDNITGTNGVLTNPTIYAAMLTIQHSFRVQNHRDGVPLGTLAVRGAIGQQYRGSVGTNSGGSIASGYLKDYVYDNRLKALSPPYFIDPVASAWHTATWAECLPASPPSTSVCN
jgi:Tfp pilus assembly protein PilX